MREFSFSFDVPTTCDCCGHALKPHEGMLTRGKYQFQLPEGERSTEIRVGIGTRIVLGGGRLIIELLGGKSAWELQPLYNHDAFKLSCKSRNGDWYSFCFELPEFKPAFDTWWAELKFAEIDPFKRTAGGKFARPHDGGTFSARLLTLK